MSLPFRTVAICGPTASGKSALSLQLARELSAEIVNVDSVQVYQGLDIGSAKLSCDERLGIPHHVLDIFSPQSVANVAVYRAAAISAIDDISSRGKLPMLVGGSGMYFTVLLHGLADVPGTPDAVRSAVAAMTPAEQYAELVGVDPITAARLNPNDSQRVSRALEIFRVTGKPASAFFAEHRFTPVDVRSLVIVLCCPRDELYRKIDLRSQQMVERGLLSETAQLLGIHGRIPVLDTLGYKQACDCLEGKLEEGVLAQEIALHTRRFAKRQMTYWRNEPKKRGWMVRPTEDEPAVMVEGFSDFPSRAQTRMKGFRAFEFSEDQLAQRIRERLSKPLEVTEVWYVTMEVNPYAR